MGSEKSYLYLLQTRKIQNSRNRGKTLRLLLTTLTISDEATKGFFGTEITEHSNFGVTRGSGGN